MRKKHKFPPKWLVTLVWIIGFLLLWEFGAFLVENNPKIRNPEYILPHMWQIFASFFDTNLTTATQTPFQVVLEACGATLSRAGIGFLIGLSAGFILALLMNLSHIVEKIAFPYLMLIQVIPILGLAPIILALTGDIGISRMVIAAILTFYPVSANTLAGFKSVSMEQKQLMFNYAAKTPVTYWKLMFPTCIPYFFTGLKTAAPMAITASILVDTLQGDGGLGCALSQSLKHNTTIYVFWEIVIVAAAVGIFSFYLMGMIENMVSPLQRINRKVKRGDKG